MADDEQADLACAWCDYRKEYGVSAAEMNAARKAFQAGWAAARGHDDAGVLR